MAAHAPTPSTQRLRHRACCEFEASPGNIDTGQPGLQCETVSIKRKRKKEVGREKLGRREEIGE